MTNAKKPSIDKYKKTFGVSVTGDVLLTSLEIKIVDTKDFQRLRQIKQLGPVYHVYPSAVHTRFEHSLGVLNHAQNIIDHIVSNKHSTAEQQEITDDEVSIIRLLALLHDIGHMPFGHTIEDEFGILPSHDEQEMRWQYFLGSDKDIGKLIIKNKGHEFYEKFYNLITCDKDFYKNELGDSAFMYDIVSNTVCADLLDYVERDSFYTNLKLSYHPRFLNYFYIAKRKRDLIVSEIGDEKKIIKVEERRVGIRAYKRHELRRDIISELVQLLRNRYYLGERVYYHHTKIKTGTVIAGAILRAKFAGMLTVINEEDIKNHIDAENVKPSHELYNIHKMGDDELVNFLINLKEKSVSEKASIDKKKQLHSRNRKIRGAKALAKDFKDRVLYTQIIYKTKEDLGIIDKFDTHRINDGKKATHKIARDMNEKWIGPGTSLNRLDLEDDICEYLDMEAGEILMYCPNFNMAMKMAKALISNEEGELEELWNFPDRSVISECKAILKKHQSLWAFRVYIHPKYINDKSNLNLERIDLIKKYFRWKVLYKSDEEKTENAKMFWNRYTDYFLKKYDTYFDKVLPKLKLVEVDKRKSELTSELINMSFDGNADYNIISKKIIGKFHNA